jgi:hypothetical protein
MRFVILFSSLVIGKCINNNIMQDFAADNAIILSIVFTAALFIDAIEFLNKIF